FQYPAIWKYFIGVDADRGGGVAVAGGLRARRPGGLCDIRRGLPLGGAAGRGLLMEPPVCAPVPAGSFLMGCERGRDEEKPEHRVRVDAFEMAVWQVRNRDYACFVEATGRAAPPLWQDPDFGDPDQPVVSVSWFDADAYCAWLT